MLVRDDLGALIGTALLLGTGLALFLSAAPLLRDSLRDEPVTMPCAKWRSLSMRPKWVTLTDCPLDLTSVSPDGAYLPLVNDAASVRMIIEAKRAPSGPTMTVSGLVSGKDVLVLREGEAPPRARVLGAAAIGFLAMVLALVPVARRLAFARERP